MALQLEPDHLAEIRAGDRRQLDGLRDHGATRESHVSAACSDPGFLKLAADRSRGVLVGRHAERREEASRAQPLADGDHVDLAVAERESDDVAHRPALAAGRSAEEPPVPDPAWVRATSDQRQYRGTESAVPTGRRPTMAVRTRPTGTGPPAHASMRNVSEVVRWLPRRSPGGRAVRSVYGRRPISTSTSA